MSKEKRPFWYIEVIRQAGSDYEIYATQVQQHAEEELAVDARTTSHGTYVVLEPYLTDGEIGNLLQQLQRLGVNAVRIESSGYASRQSTPEVSTLDLAEYAQMQEHLEYYRTLISAWKRMTKDAAESREWVEKRASLIVEQMTRLGLKQIKHRDLVVTTDGVGLWDNLTEELS